jgi:hypothetical protein
MSRHTPHPFDRLVPEEIPSCRQAIDDVMRAFLCAQGYAHQWFNYQVTRHTEHESGHLRLWPLPTLGTPRADGDGRLAHLLCAAARDLASAIDNLDRYVEVEPTYVWLRVGGSSATSADLKAGHIDVSLAGWLNRETDTLRASPGRFDVRVWHQTGVHIRGVQADLLELLGALDTRAAALGLVGGGEQAATPVPANTAVVVNPSADPPAAGNGTTRACDGPAPDTPAPDAPPGDGSTTRATRAPDQDRSPAAGEGRAPSTGPSAAGHREDADDDTPVTLVFLPGGFKYGGELCPLRGKPLDVLKALYRAPDRALTLRDLQRAVWGVEPTGEEAVRSAIMRARNAVRGAMLAAGVSAPADPIPCVERGTDRTAWRLDLA